MKTTIVMKVSKIIVQYESHIEFIKDDEYKDNDFLLKSLKYKGIRLTNTYDSLKDFCYELSPFIGASKNITIDDNDYDINTVDDKGREVFIIR